MCWIQKSCCDQKLSTALMATVIAPEQATKQIIKTLKTAGSPARAAQSHVYFKSDEDVKFYGLAAQETRQIEREFFAMVKGSWTYEGALRFCDLRIWKKYLEAKQIGFELLTRFKRHFTTALRQ